MIVIQNATLLRYFCVPICYFGFVLLSVAGVSARVGLGLVLCVFVGSVGGC